MDLVTLKCVKCRALLGNIENSWIQIGKGYLSSTAKPDALKDFWVRASGNTRYGGTGTIMEGCQLQYVLCNSCDANLGLQCVGTTEEHILKEYYRPYDFFSCSTIDSWTRNQIIFRASSINMRLASDQRCKADPKIERVVKLDQSKPRKEPSEESVSSPSPAPGPYAGFSMFDEAECDEDVDIYQLQIDLQEQREDIQKIGSTGMQVVSNFEKSMQKVESGLQDIQGSVAGLRRDGQRRDTDLASLKNELKGTRKECSHMSSISELKQQFQATGDVVSQLRGIVARAQSDAESLRIDLSLREDKLDHLTTRNKELQQEIAGIKKVAKESAVIVKGYAKRNEQLKRDVSTIKKIADEGVSTAKGYSSEVSTLRKELKQLRADLAEEKMAREESERERERLEREMPTSTSAAVSSLSSSEIDILAKWISKIGNRVNQVESKQTEFDLFKSRMQSGPFTTSSRASIGGSQGLPNIGDVDSLEDESPSIRLRGPGNQKRKRPLPESYEADEGEMGLPSAKRADHTSDYYSATTTASSSIGNDQDSSPWGTTPGDSTGVRLTKSGFVDKRCLKFAQRERNLVTKETAKG